MLGVKFIQGFLLVAGTVAVFSSQVDGYLNCQSTSSIEAAFKSCLHDQGIDVNLVNHQSASMEDALMSEHVETICSYPRDSYKRAMECIGGISRKCLPEDYKFLLPEPSQMGEMMARICDHHQDMDLHCAASQAHLSKQCGRMKGLELHDEKVQMSRNELQCWTFEVEFDCVLETYTSCNCQTAKVYSDIVLDIMMPSSCDRKRELEERRLVCDASTTGRGLAPPTSPSPAPPLPLLSESERVTADCSSARALKGSIVECFTTRGIHDDQLYYSFKNSVSPPNTLLETLFLNHGDSACSSEKQQYKEAVRCTFRLLRDCTPYSMKQYFPTLESASGHIDTLCEHRNEIDFLCASKKVTAIQSCAHRKGTEYNARGGTRSGLLCFAFKAEFECSQEVYKSCGCKTAKIYSDLSFDLRYPKSCPREELERQRLHCEKPHNNKPTVDLGIPDSGVLYNLDSSQCLEMKKQDIINCYVNRGFRLTDQEIRTSLGIFYGSALNAVMDGNNMCSRMGEARRAVRCEAEILHYCSSSKHTGFLDKPDTLLEILQGLCGVWHDIDNSCANRQLSRFGLCMQSRIPGAYGDLRYDDQRLCREMSRIGDCSKDILLTCGCPTARAYSNVIYNVMVPPVCHQSDDAPKYMKCDGSNPYVYSHHSMDGSGGGSRLPCAVWSLAFVLCLARLFASYL